MRISKKLAASMGILATATALATPNAYVPFGVVFNPEEGAQGPNSTIPAAQIKARLKQIEGSAQWVRTLTATHGMQNFGQLAHADGFKVALGIRLGNETNAGSTNANLAEINAGIAAANSGQADVLVVGDHALETALPYESLLKYIGMARSGLATNIPVTTCDDYSTFQAVPSLISNCDLVMADFFLYTSGNTRIDGAVSTLDYDYKQLQNICGDKPLWIGGTSWPSAGIYFGLGVPNSYNAAYYFQAFNSWARDNNVNSFYDGAFDVPSEGTHEGIRSANGALKVGMNWVYQGNELPASVYMRTVPVSVVLPPAPWAAMTATWNGSPLLATLPLGQTAQITAAFRPGMGDAVTSGFIAENDNANSSLQMICASNGPVSQLSCSFTAQEPGTYVFYAGGTTAAYSSNLFNSFEIFVQPPAGAPSLGLEEVPAYGATGSVSGLVFNVKPADCEVGAYLYKEGGWWSDSNIAAPDTNGDFLCGVTPVPTADYTNVTQIELFVWSNNFVPPSSSGGSIPQEAIQSAIVYTNIDRPEGFPGFPIVVLPPGFNGVEPQLPGIPGALPCTVSALSSSSYFGTASSTDSLTLSGTLLDITNTPPAGATIAIKLGQMSNEWDFAPLAKNGRAAVIGGTNVTDPSGSIAAKMGARAWTFAATLKSAADSANWTPEGMVNATMNSLPVFIPVEIDVNGKPFTNIVSGLYTSTTNISGKLPKANSTVPGLGLE